MDGYRNRNPYKSASCTMIYNRIVFPGSDSRFAFFQRTFCSRQLAWTGTQLRI